MSHDAGLTMYHIPICPFCQRLEILLALKGRRDEVAFKVVDITVPRPDWLQQKMGTTTALPVLETADGKIIKESLVILRYLEDLLPDPPVQRADPYEHAVENMLIALEGDFVAAGYRMVLNQDKDAAADFRTRLLAQYARLNAFLVEHSPAGPFLFDDFGLAEAVYTPMFMRFWFLDYYEDFALPETGDYARVAQWRDACLAHPSAQQVSKEQIVKLYYDYALGAGNGALLEGRTRSSFAFEPHWSVRPMPPRDKWGHKATDAELGLV